MSTTELELVGYCSWISTADGISKPFGIHKTVERCLACIGYYYGGIFFANLSTLRHRIRNDGMVDFAELVLSATPLSKALVSFLRIILMFSAFTRHFGLFFDDSLYELSVDLRTGNGQYVHSATRSVSMQATALSDDIVLISVWDQRLAG